MHYKPAIRTSRLAILDYYLSEAAKPDEEWTCTLEPSLKDMWQTDPAKDRELVRAIDRYDGRGETPVGWVKTTYPSIVQKIGRKLDRKKPQCFACLASFDDWRRGLERAHIVAESAGGPDIPSNFVLLCPDCHLDAPMTNRADWMLEWVDRGPAAAGWGETDALEAATEAEMLAALNYVPVGGPYASVDECLKYTIEAADVSADNLKRTFHELADEVEAEYHFGQSSFSPATRAYLRLEAWGRIAIDQPRRKATEGE